MKPLANIRILDLSKVLAGPICTQTLASLGAGVIKVENLAGGDETRRWSPVVGGTGTAYLSANSGKRSIALDLRSAEGRRVVARLAQQSDIVVESFAPGVAQKLGVDHATLAARNPRLIYCSISGYGQSGPKKSLPGYDAILQSFTGLMALNGSEDGDPVRLPTSPVDQVTALYAVQAIMAALMQRSIDGQGRRIEVSLLEAAIKMLGSSLQAYWATGKVPRRAGSGHPSISPYELFQTADRPILVAVANEKFWTLFCKTAGLEDLRDHPDFATNPDRVEHNAALVERMSAALRRRPAVHWLALFEAEGIPAAPLNTLADLFEDEHCRGLDIVRSYEHPELGLLRSVREPVRFDGERSDPQGAPPALGEHGREILARDLGMDAAEIDALIESGVIGDDRAAEENPNAYD